jgi:hypothetical protein
MEHYLQKGDRVTAEWLETEPVALAGVQMKLGGTTKTVTGVVTHIRGDHPTEPTSIGIAILDDEGKEHWVDSNYIKEIHNENT